MENRTYESLTGTEKRQLALTLKIAGLLENSSEMEIEEFRAPMTNSETELARCQTPGDTLAFPLVTGFTVYEDLPSGEFYELTVRNREHLVPALPVRVYLLKVYSHGLGILGVFPTPEAAQSAAQADLNLRQEAEAESLGEKYEPVTLSTLWQKEPGRPWRAVFSEGAMEHAYEVQQLTVGELLNGF